MVLEGFQRTQENGLKLAEKEYQERLSRERLTQSGLQEEIRLLKEDVTSANEGLAAASRLSEQLDKKSQVIATLKQEVKLRDELLKKAQGELSSVSNNNAGKVDKYLVKNLVVGYVAADFAKQAEVLKVIATVLDFNGDERLKTGLEGGSNTTWLRGWFAQQPQRGRRTTSDEVQATTGMDQSLAQAFIQFLETESTPKVQMKLPVSEMADEKLSSRKSSVSGTPPLPLSYTRTTPDRHSPNSFLAVNNSHSAALPTFSVNRSSSAILKHVLHEESQQDQQQGK